MTWTTADIPDLTDRTAVVTGANGGLGLETARALADAGAHVVMAARDQEKAVAAEAEIRSTVDTANLQIVQLDLGSLDSVRTAAERIAEHHGHIDILVNNAGLMAQPERRTVDGFEMQLGVNHLGHWAFTSLLLPAILAARAPRVVTVTSTAHHMGRAVRADNPHLDGSYGPWKAYGQSKLANYHFGLGLQQRFEAAGVQASSLIAHPGLSNTDLQARSVEESGGFLTRFFHGMAARTGMTPFAGAHPQLRAATDPEAVGGSFYAPRYVNFGPAVRRPVMRRIGLQKHIDSLWSISETQTGIALDVARSVS
jgi:NAD(P)-dependent dehydrogenase (short-subunit alcohol dehydrogenase family)